MCRKFDKEVEEHFIQESGKTMKKLEIFGVKNIQENV